MKTLLSDLHPFFTHFPIVMVLITCFFEFITIRKLRDQGDYLVLIFLGATILFSLLSFFSGLSAADYSNKTFQVPDDQIALHYNWARAFTFLAPVVFGVKYAEILSKEKNNNSLKWVFRALLLVLTGFALIAGNLGGDLVFEYGAGVEALR